jgi:hypothetical protein
MLKINRPFLMQVHLILATFIFPIILMFLITGALYTLGVRGSYDTQVYPLKLSTPLSKDSDTLTELITKELENLYLAPPTGETRNKSTDERIELEWRGAALRVTLASTPQPTEATLTVQKASLYKRLIELHTANGATAFRIYAIVLAVSLFILLVTGFIMALQLPKYRKLTLYSTLTGMAVFILMVVTG